MERWRDGEMERWRLGERLGQSVKEGGTKNDWGGGWGARSNNDLGALGATALSPSLAGLAELHTIVLMCASECPHTNTPPRAHTHTHARARARTHTRSVTH